jgi:ATP-dependent Zn protease
VKSHRTVAAAALLAVAVAAPAGAAVQSTESYTALVGQIDAGKVAKATINKLPHDVKVTLKDGSIQTVLYPSRQEKTLEASLRSHGALVKFAKHKKKHKATVAHHRLRYIAGGLLAALIVLGGGAYVFSRRHESPGADGASPGAAPESDPPSQDPAGTT